MNRKSSPPREAQFPLNSFNRGSPPPLKSPLHLVENLWPIYSYVSKFHVKNPITTGVVRLYNLPMFLAHPAYFEISLNLGNFSLLVSELISNKDLCSQIWPRSRQKSEKIQLQTIPQLSLSTQIYLSTFLISPEWGTSRKWTFLVSA